MTPKQTEQSPQKAENSSNKRSTVDGLGSKTTAHKLTTKPNVANFRVGQHLTFLKLLGGGGGVSVGGEELNGVINI